MLDVPLHVRLHEWQAMGSNEEFGIWVQHRGVSIS